MMDRGVVQKEMQEWVNRQYRMENWDVTTTNLMTRYGRREEEEVRNREIEEGGKGEREEEK